jgi:hypothetical protein
MSLLVKGRGEILEDTKINAILLTCTVGFRFIDAILQMCTSQLPSLFTSGQRFAHHLALFYIKK